MPSGLSSERAAAFKPLTNSLSTSGSSLMMRTRLTGFFMGGAQNENRIVAANRGRVQGGNANKKGGLAAFFSAAPDLVLSRHRFESRGKAALVPRCLVLVDDVLVGDAIHDSRGLAENLPRGGLVAGGDRFGDAFDRAGQRRAQAGVVLAPLLGLARRLARALGIRHGEPRTKGRNCSRSRWAAQGLPTLKAIIPA